MLYTQKAAGAGYAGAVLAAVGVFPTIAVDIAWAGGNAGGDLKRGVVLAMVIGLGNLGGYVFISSSCEGQWADPYGSICSSFIYIDPPRFHIGHGTMQVAVISYYLPMLTLMA